MDTHNRLTPFDIEPLLMDKKPQEWTDKERSFLAEQLGGEAQIIAYREMLLLTESNFAWEDSKDLEPDPSIRYRLQQQFSPVVISDAQKNSLSGGLLATVFGWFSLKNPMHSGMALAGLALAFWFGGNFNEAVGPGASFQTDTLIHQAQLVDSVSINEQELAVGVATYNDSVQNRNFNGTDSFLLNGNHAIRQTHP